MRNLFMIQNLRKQRGAILATSLLFLTILTLLGLSAMNKTSIQNKLSANDFNRDLAFQAGESSLVAGEELISALTSIPQTVTTCATSPCNVIWATNALDANFKGSATYWWSTYNIDQSYPNWWPTYGRALNSTTQVVSYVNQQPMYVVEQYGYIPDDLNPATSAKGVGTYYYRITARGVGGVAANAAGASPNQSYLQSIYAKRFN